ncbi:MAG: hypothetical protein ABR530_08880, partial [Pyrinomonadaceae bacterium]
MLDKLLILACVLIFVLSCVVVEFPLGLNAALLTTVLGAAAVFLFRRTTDEKRFITQTFLTALVLRMAFGIFVHVLELRDFFGGDAFSYDEAGAGMIAVWLGSPTAQDMLIYRNTALGSAWGMHYLTGAIYFVIGRNIFAAQSFCAVIGAATAPMVFLCSKKIYKN